MVGFSTETVIVGGVVWPPVLSIIWLETADELRKRGHTVIVGSLSDDGEHRMMGLTKAVAS